MTFRPLSSDQHQQTAPIPLHQPRVVARTEADARRRHRRHLMIVFCWIAITVLVSAQALGQANYKTIPLKPANMADEANAKRLVSAAKSYAGGGDTNRMVPFYFTRYIPAILTNEEYLPQVSQAMEDYHDILDRAERSGRNLRDIQNQALRVMKVLAEGNYLPSARIAAINVLARLDAQPANVSAKKPPVPLPTVLPILVNLYKNEQNNDGVRAAALHGIHRHVSYSFSSYSAAVKNGLVGMMTQLLDSEPPSGRSPRAHAYLQRYAVDIMDKLREKGDTKLGEKLISISTTADHPSVIALYSAATLGQIGAEMKGKIDDPARVLESWTRRALIVLEAELERLEALDRAEPAAGQPPSPDSNSTSGGSSSSGSNRRKKGGGLGALGSATPSRSRGSSDVDTFDDDAPGGMKMGGGGLGALGGNRRGRQRREPRRVEKSLPGANQPPQVVASRRKLNQALQLLHLGATGSPTTGMPAGKPGGLLASVAEGARAEVDNWVDEMRSLFDEINSEYLETREAYMEVLAEQIDLMRERVGEPPVERPDGNPAENAPVDPPPPPPPGAAEDAPAGAEPPAELVDDLGA